MTDMMWSNQWSVYTKFWGQLVILYKYTPKTTNRIRLLTLNLLGEWGKYMPKSTNRIRLLTLTKCKLNRLMRYFLDILAVSLKLSTRHVAQMKVNSEPSKHILILKFGLNMKFHIWVESRWRVKTYLLRSSCQGKMNCLS